MCGKPALRFRTSGFPQYGFKRRALRSTAACRRFAWLPVRPAWPRAPLFAAVFAPHIGFSACVSGGSWPCLTPYAEPRTPTGPCSDRVMLSRSSSLLRPDVPDSAPPPDFTSWLIPAALAVTARRGGSGALPGFASYALTPCRCPYAARVPECTCPSLPRGYQSSPICAGLDPLIFRHSLPPV